MFTGACHPPPLRGKRRHKPAGLGELPQGYVCCRLLVAVLQQEDLGLAVTYRVADVQAKASKSSEVLEQVVGLLNTDDKQALNGKRLLQPRPHTREDLRGLVCESTPTPAPAPECVPRHIHLHVHTYSGLR